MGIEMDQLRARIAEEQEAYEYSTHRYTALIRRTSENPNDKAALDEAVAEDRTRADIAARLKVLNDQISVVEDEENGPARQAQIALAGELYSQTTKLIDERAILARKFDEAAASFLSVAKEWAEHNAALRGVAASFLNNARPGWLRAMRYSAESITGISPDLTRIAGNPFAATVSDVATVLESRGLVEVSGVSRQCGGVPELLEQAIAKSQDKIKAALTNIARSEGVIE